MFTKNRRVIATMFGLSAMWVGCSSQGTRSNENAGGSDNSGGDTASNGGADNGGSGGNQANGGVAGTTAVATGGQGGRATGGSTGGTSTSSGGRGTGGASGGSGGTANTGGASGGSGGTVAGRVPMFVAVGDGQHTTVSCDDGRTWVEDKFLKATDDDFSHDETNVLGSAYLDGSFYFLMGWANPVTQIFSSPDGVNWTNRYTGLGSEGMTLSVGQGALVFGNEDKIHRSTNGGASWSAVTIPISFAHMQQVFGDFGGGRFYAGDETAGVYSDDVGVTWKRASQSCGGIPVAGGTTFLSYEQWGKTICRSIDGGATWQNLSTCCGTEYIHTIFWDGTRFLLFNSKLWSSVDGVNWTREAATGVEAFASVARSSVTGTYVATQQGWLPGVAFFRSTDGIHWTKLPPTAHSARGANLEYIRFGFGSPSANCRAP
jgi:hypothetical protein